MRSLSRCSRCPGQFCQASVAVREDRAYLIRNSTCSETLFTVPPTRSFTCNSTPSERAPCQPSCSNGCYNMCLHACTDGQRDARTHAHSDGRQRQDQVHGKKNQVAQDASGIPVLFFSAIICMCILSHRLFCAIPSCDDTQVTVRAALPAPHASTHKVVCALVIYSPFSAVTGQVELGAGGTQKGSKRQGNADCRANEHNQRVCCHH